MRRPKRALRLRLWDILKAISVARRAVGSLPIEGFETAEVPLFAAERAIEVVSEASRHIPSELKGQHPQLPWAQIAAIGNVIRHGYDSVDPEIIWKLVTEELGPLETAVQRMLDELKTE